MGQADRAGPLWVNTVESCWEDPEFGIFLVSSWTLWILKSFCKYHGPALFLLSLGYTPFPTLFGETDDIYNQVSKANTGQYFISTLPL